MFNESNTVEQMILDAVAKLGRTPASWCARTRRARGASLGGELRRALELRSRLPKSRASPAT